MKKIIIVLMAITGLITGISCSNTLNDAYNDLHKGITGSGGTVPAAPSGVSATQGSFMDRTEITWLEVTGAATYTIYRSDSSGGSFSSIGTVSSGLLSYSDTSCSEDVHYWYAVSATNAYGEGSKSGESEGWRYSLKPAAPLYLNASAGNYLNKAALTWNSVTGADSYSVYRSDSSGGTYSLIQSGLTVVNFDDTTGVQNTHYWYKVTATNSYGEGLKSSGDEGWSSNLPPDAPAGVEATPGRSDGVLVYWNSVDGANSYNIYRCATYNGTYTEVRTGNTSTSYLDYPPSVNTDYWYKVTAVSEGGESVLSDFAVGSRSI